MLFNFKVGFIYFVLEKIRTTKPMEYQSICFFLWYLIIETIYFVSFLSFRLPVVIKARTERKRDNIYDVDCAIYKQIKYEI